MSSATLIHDLAVEFHRLGHEPIVVAPDENILQEHQVSCENGIKVLRIRTGKIKSATRFVRAFNEIKLSKIIWKKGKQFFDENTCDLIIYYSPSIFFSSLVKRLKKKICLSILFNPRRYFPRMGSGNRDLAKGISILLFQI